MLDRAHGSDDELTARAGAGDQRAVLVLRRRHEGAAASLAASVLGPGTMLVEDTMAEAFANTQSALLRGGTDLAFRPLLLQHVVRVAQSHMAASSPTGTSAPVVVDLTRSESAASLVVGTAQDRSALHHEAFAALERDDQAALWMADVEQAPVRLTAETLGARRREVSRRVGRSRAKLRAELVAAHLRTETDRQCRDIVGQLERHLSGRLSQAHEEEVAEHLEECDRCHGLSLELSDLARSLRLAVAPTVLGTGAAVLWLSGGGGSVGVSAGSAGAGGGRGGRASSVVASTVAVVAAASLAFAAIGTADQRAIGTRGTDPELAAEIASAARAADGGSAEVSGGSSDAADGAGADSADPPIDNQPSTSTTSTSSAGAAPTTTGAGFTPDDGTTPTSAATSSDSGDEAPSTTSTTSGASAPTPADAGRSTPADPSTAQATQPSVTAPTAAPAASTTPPDTVAADPVPVDPVPVIPTADGPPGPAGPDDAGLGDGTPPVPLDPANPADPATPGGEDVGDVPPPIGDKVGMDDQPVVDEEPEITGPAPVGVTVTAVGPVVADRPTTLVITVDNLDPDPVQDLVVEVTATGDVSIAPAVSEPTAGAGEVADQALDAAAEPEGCVVSDTIRCTVAELAGGSRIELAAVLRLLPPEEPVRADDAAPAEQPTSWPATFAISVTAPGTDRGIEARTGAGFAVELLASGQTVRRREVGALEAVLTGNTIVGCTSVPVCGPDGTYATLDSDGDRTTANSSGGEIRFTNGTVVRWAGLYWGGGLPGDLVEIGNGNGNKNGNGNAANGLKRVCGTGETTKATDQRNDRAPVFGTQPGQAKKLLCDYSTVSFQTAGGGGYQPLVADDIQVTGERYQAMADVTTLVRFNPNGQYWLADLSVAEDVPAGWALVIVFETAADEQRAVSILDGLTALDPDTSMRIDVGGLSGESTGPTTVGIVTYGGVPGAQTDTVTVDGVVVENAASSPDDAFSGVPALYGEVTDGFDVDTFVVDTEPGEPADALAIEVTTSTPGLHLGLVVVSG